jgi:hypothetical protein
MRLPMVCTKARPEGVKAESGYTQNCGEGGALAPYGRRASSVGVGTEAMRRSSTGRPESTIAGGDVSSHGIASSRQMGQSDSPAHPPPSWCSSWETQHAAWSSQWHSWKWLQPGSRCRPFPRNEITLTTVSRPGAANCRKKDIKAATCRASEKCSGPTTRDYHHSRRCCQPPSRLFREPHASLVRRGGQSLMKSPVGSAT